MKKTYEVDIFSSSSIKRLQKELISYKNSINDRCEKIVTKLIDVGFNVAKTQIQESPLCIYISIEKNISKVKNEVKAVLVAKGTVLTSENYAPFNTLLAIEFGAGIHYNKKENPKSKEFGLGVGTFPGQTHAFQEEGWYFWDEKGQKWSHSYGVKATMPMHNADVETLNQVEKVVKEVFK